MDFEQPRLLIVEDDEGDFMLIERAFGKARIVNELVRAKDGVEALEIIRGTNGADRFRRPFFILCDINMPRMDGLSFVAELRKDPELKDTVVFMLTTSKHDEDRRHAYEMNVAGYILKSQAGRDFLNVMGLLDAYVQVVVFP